MIIRKRFALATAALTLGSGLAILPATGASAAAYDGQSPVTSGCANSAITARAENIYVDGEKIGKIELRYSTSCRTAWGRVTAYYLAGNGQAHVVRISDKKSYYCDNTDWSDVLNGFTCYTAMVNDAGVTSLAWGQVDDFDTGETGYGFTESY
ncbi:DUF2690 domain-containing protein [Streptomyces canus]|uniref:DUF2690 domain-containing protein n=1 Tax=Streptomyces canus TaxID=58343 RepID=A0AAW8FX47_9ACTN|nr:DUF2690 domain-containing protein [Streptomyces canus]MDQ0757549.1 hypothetical protein [Streptomyces canus]MDQ0913496.1 hypothetical protein [Streptomyces canus]MDQ1073752.1 hypothetical protein [Streptomyces canus]